MAGHPSYSPFQPQSPSYFPYQWQAQPSPMIYYPHQPPVLSQPLPPPQHSAWFPPQETVETGLLFPQTTSRALLPPRNPRRSSMFVKKITNYIRPQASIQEVKDWISRIDANNDGVITQEELEDALREFRMYLVDWRAKRAMNRTDLNRNGLIDTDAEVNELMRYAMFHWGAAIHAYK